MATGLLTTLYEAHSSIHFITEIATNNQLPFVGMEIIKIAMPWNLWLSKNDTQKASYSVSKEGGKDFINEGDTWQ